MRRWWDTEEAQRSLLLSSVHCRHLSRLVYLSTSTGSLFTSAAVYIVQRCPDTVCPYLLCPGGSFASVRPHSRADHSLGQEPEFTCTHGQCALGDLRGRAQFGKCMEGNQRRVRLLGQESFTLVRKLRRGCNAIASSAQTRV